MAQSQQTQPIQEAELEESMIRKKITGIRKTNSSLKETHAKPSPAKAL